MSETFYYVGEVRKGDKIQVPIETVGLGWTPGYFDIVDNDSMTILKADQAVTSNPTDLYGVSFVSFEIADEFLGPGSTRSLTFYEGRSYTILIKENAGQFGTDNTNRFLCHFRIAADPKQTYLGSVEYGKTFRFMHREEANTSLYFDVINPENGSIVLGNTAMSGPEPGNRTYRGEFNSETLSLTIGRTYYIRVKNQAVDDPNLDWLYSFTVTPPLEQWMQRLLAAGGENVVMDNFSYDQAGNILGLRVRHFSTASGAQNATPGVTDPEPDEISSYIVEQEHNVARNVRTLHRAYLEYESDSVPGEG